MKQRIINSNFFDRSIICVFINNVEVERKWYEKGASEMKGNLSGRNRQFYLTYPTATQITVADTQIRGLWPRDQTALILRLTANRSACFLRPGNKVLIHALRNVFLR